MTVRISFAPWTAPNRLVQITGDDVLADDETVQFDGPWLHVVKIEETVGGVEYKAARSYPEHVVSMVRWEDPS